MPLIGIMLPVSQHDVRTRVFKSFQAHFNIANTCSAKIASFLEVFNFELTTPGKSAHTILVPASARITPPISCHRKAIGAYVRVA